MSCMSNMSELDSCLEHFDKGFLGDVDGTEGLHAFLAFLLLLQEFALAADVAAIALRGHVFAQRADGFAGNDFTADGGLNGDGVLLAGDDFLELGGEGASPALRFVTVHDA